MEYLEKAPNEKQKHFRKLEEKLLSNKQKIDDENEKKEEPMNIGLISFINQPDTEDLCLESGTPCHIVKDRPLFIEFRPFHRKFSVSKRYTFGGTQHQQDSDIFTQTHQRFQRVLKATQNLISMESDRAARSVTARQAYAEP